MRRSTEEQISRKRAKTWELNLKLRMTSTTYREPSVVSERERKRRMAVALSKLTEGDSNSEEDESIDNESLVILLSIEESISNGSSVILLSKEESIGKEPSVVSERERKRRIAVALSKLIEGDSNSEEEESIDSVRTSPMKDKIIGLTVITHAKSVDDSDLSDID